MWAGYKKGMVIFMNDLLKKLTKKALVLVACVALGGMLFGVEASAEEAQYKAEIAQ